MIQEVAKDLQLGVLTQPMEQDSTGALEERALATSLLRLARALDRVARGSEKLQSAASERTEI